MSAITFTIFPPSDALTRDVECFRVATYNGGQSLAVKVCPNGLPGIVFQLGQAGPAIEDITTRSAHISGLPILFLHGQGSEPSVMRFAAAPYTTIQVVLKPQALYTLFGFDASARLAGIMDAAEFGAGALETQLVAAAGDAERITLLATFLLRQLEQAWPRDALIETSLDLVRSQIDSITVKTLIAQLHLSERQFQKRFARVVGCPPQVYIRVKRVNEALRLMHTGQYERLSDIAYALNYYDQSHFIRDIKALSWVTPKSLAQKVSDFHQDQAGASYL
jgi:AraC-like DNA-binding protein